ncbi:hypothetical protein [Listeria seeligeri]|uniref:DUF5082 domain-containing protein n=2 Tax=Listeria seeligeri TaxID=1640 RepID=A0ABR5EBU0_LISSE|nr:hypothetical protein [Listeria seeligeri]KKD50566.1 hypothetical protein UQ68_01655 [Listeria seeligeri]MBC1577850.1 hypothetical protein [Listeria seeligeri]MBC1579114.1 hypothetical protein [Listeria seeligeri]MBC1593859.1 hypothetical protein [Listeria seeligeri]MBC1596227.1 hypothetical protein [Listeria seeligeri]
MDEKKKKQQKSKYEDKKRKLNAKSSTCGSCIADLKKANTSLEANIREWKTHKSKAYTGIAGEIFVTNVFEGVVAKELSKDFPESVKVMDDNVAKAKEICREIKQQIQSLQSLQSTIKVDIASINNKIANL